MTRKNNKRSIVVDGHKTSVVIDDKTYSLLKHIAKTEGRPFYALAEEIDRARVGATSSFSEALRLHALNWSLGHVQTTGGVLLRKLLKDGGGTEDGFLVASMNWALNKAGIVVEVSRGTV